ncbi:MAG: TolB protein, partial [Porticoccaceae bacterium]
MIHAKRLLLLLLICSFAAQAEWTNRYPKVDGQRHHIYLESYELPILSSGPKYPAPSPDGESIAFASHGWIWVMDISTQMATRVTNGESIDGRPRWSGDSRHLAFVRDNSTDSSIVIIELGTDKTVEINTPTIELDPEFAPDGKSIYLSSGKSGLLNIWRYNLKDGAMTMITDLDGHSRNPRLSTDGNTLFFSHLDWPERQIRSLNLESGEETILKTDSIGGQFSFDMHPTKDVVSYTWPVNDDLNLMLADVAKLNPIINLTPGRTYIQDPAWSADGSSVYYSEPDSHQQFKMKQVSALGG